MTRRIPGGLGLLMLAGGLLVTGCGKENNDNSFSSVDEPALQLSEPGGGTLQLVLPTLEKRPQRQALIRLRSAGDAPLKLTGVEWVGDKPDRVFVEKGRTEDVDESACSSDIYYAQSRVCVETGAPDLSAEIPSGTFYDLQLHVAPYDIGETNAIDCPDPPDGTPADVVDRYCGALRITSNARNTSGQVEEGAALVYLLADRASGEVSLTTPTLSFQNVGPGFSDSRMFGITNSGDDPLTISGVGPSDFGQFISVGGPDTPLELAPQESAQFTVSIELPATISESELELLSSPSTAPEISIESTAPNSPHAVRLSLDTSRVIPPIPQPDTTQITFGASGDEQDVTFTNPGDKPVTLTGVSFEPFEAEDYYTVLHEGEEFSGPLVIQDASESNPDRNKATLSIRYTAPTDMSSPLASMILTYNYFVGDVARTGKLRITLLGDRAMAAYGDLVPSTFSFSTKASETQTRTAAIYNLGTAPLTVDSVDYMAQAGGFEEFSINLAGGANFPVTIDPGAVQALEVTFTPTDGDVDQVAATLMSNSDTTQPLLITLSSLEVDVPDTEMTIVPSFDEKAAVGELTTFEITGVDEPVANNAEWTLLSRPSGSSIYLKSTGPRAGITPDTAGTYELLVTSSDASIDVQTTYSFEVE